MITHGGKAVLSAADSSLRPVWPLIVASGAIVVAAALVAGGLNLARKEGGSGGRGGDGVEQRLRHIECTNLVRQLASRNRSMLDGRAFREDVARAQVICMQDPAVFRRLIRQPGPEPAR